SAKDLGTGKEQKITISGSSGLGENDIKRMVKDAEEHGSEDRERRAKAEARNRLDSLVYSTDRSLGEHKDKLSPDDRGKLEDALAEAKRALEGGDTAAMEAATKTLTEASHKLAEHMYAQAGPQGPGAG